MAVIDSLGRGGYRFISTSLGANPATVQTELLHATSHMREMIIPIVLPLVDCHSMIDSTHTVVVRDDTSYLVVGTNPPPPVLRSKQRAVGRGYAGRS